MSLSFLHSRFNEKLHEIDSSEIDFALFKDSMPSYLHAYLRGGSQTHFVRQVSTLPDVNIVKAGT